MVDDENTEICDRYLKYDNESPVQLDYDYSTAICDAVN